MRHVSTLALLFALAGCDALPGSGVEASADLTDLLAPFDGVHTRDGIRAIVIVDAAAPRRVSLRADDNLIEHVEAYVDDDGSLRLSTGVSVLPIVPIVVEVTTDALGVLTADGADTTAIATGVADNVRFGASASRGAMVELEGSCGHLVAIASSRATLDASALSCATARVDSLGSTVRVQVSDSVLVRASGPSVIRITGSPIEVIEEITGAASVTLE